MSIGIRIKKKEIVNFNKISCLCLFGIIFLKSIYSDIAVDLKDLNNTGNYTETISIGSQYLEDEYISDNGFQGLENILIPLIEAYIALGKELADSNNTKDLINIFYQGDEIVSKIFILDNQIGEANRFWDYFYNYYSFYNRYTTQLIENSENNMFTTELSDIRRDCIHQIFWNR